MTNQETIQTKTLVNGAVIDGVTGKILTAPTDPPFNRPEVRAKALETKKRRYEMAQNRVLKGLCEAAVKAGKIPVDTDHPAGEMVQAVAATVASMIFDDNVDDKGRYIVDAKAREIVRKGLFMDAGLTPRAYAKDDVEQGSNRITLDLSDDTARALVQAMAHNAIKQGNDK
jgi:hypothetical protein